MYMQISQFVRGEPGCVTLASVYIVAADMALSNRKKPLMKCEQVWALSPRNCSESELGIFLTF